MTRLAKIAGISALFVAGWGVAPTAATAAPPPLVLACGSVVTGPITLASNLTCNGDAITLLSGTLDLHHHTITGDGTGAGLTVGADEEATATIENGTITGFETGIQGGLYKLSVKTVSITNSFDGIDGFGINYLALDHVTMNNEPDVAVIADSTQVTATHVTITHAGWAFFAIDDGGVVASNTTVSDGSVGGECSQGYFKFKNSQIARNDDGMALFECEGSTFTDTTFLSNTGAGIAVGDSYDTGDGPTLVLNGDHFQGNSIGLHLSDAAMNISVSKSVFTLNGTGILMDQCPQQDDTCLPIIDHFTSNRFAQNHGNGVTWGDGTVTMASNQFQNNSGWGFFASPGTTVVDGGGNKAQSNHAGSCNGGLVC